MADYRSADCGSSATESGSLPSYCLLVGNDSCEGEDARGRERGMRQKQSSNANTGGRQQESHILGQELGDRIESSLQDRLGVREGEEGVSAVIGTHA